MKILGVLAIVWISICILVLLLLHIKSHKMIKSILINALLGFAAILIINLTQKYTGTYIPLNWWTVGGSGLFGLPCVCAIILTQIII